MSIDDAAPSPVEDTPTPETETPDTGTPEVSTEVPGYEPDDSLAGEDRYKHLQAFATRSAQKAAELEEQVKAAEPDVQFMEALRSGDTDHALAIVEAFADDLAAKGWTKKEIEAEVSEQFGNGDTPEVRDPRVDVMIAEQQERETAQIAKDLSDHIDSLAQEKGVELTERQKKVIWIEAVDNGLTPDGTIKAFNAWLAEDYEPLQQAAVKSYRQSKRAPSPPSHGSPGVPKAPTDTKSRLAFANEVAQRAIDSAGG